MSCNQIQESKRQDSTVHIINGWKVFRDKPNNAIYLIVETKLGEKLTLATTEEALNNAISCLQTYEFDAFTLGQKV